MFLWISSLDLYNHQVHANVLGNFYKMNLFLRFFYSFCCFHYAVLLLLYSYFGGLYACISMTSP